MKTVVFPGRFQPFHNAHHALVKYLLKKYDHVIIAIGSCNLCNRSNPFTAQQRKEMIKKAVNSKKISFAFIPYACDERWVGVFLRAVPRESFDVVFTNNPRVQKQLRLRGIPFVSSKPIQRNKFKGKGIRFWGKGWEERVPRTVVHYIKSLKRKCWCYAS